MPARRTLVFVIGLLAPLTSFGQDDFATLKLSRGVQLQIPKGWWLLGKEINHMIQTSSTVALDLSGIGLPDGDKTNLLAANSMPRTTYAAVRVNSTIPSPMSPSDIQAVTTAGLQDIGSEMRAGLERALKVQNNQILQFYEIRKDSISGHPAIVIEYLRSGQQGPVIVQYNGIYTNSQEISVVLSYRESEATLWRPVVARIRQSIILAQWP